MNEPKRRFFSGDSLQQALVQAANYFNLDPQEIAYRSIEKKHGFLKVRRKVMIEVDPEAPRRQTPAPVAPPAVTAPPRPAMSAPPPASEPGDQRPEARPEGREERRDDRAPRGDRGPRRDRGDRGGRGGERRGDRGGERRGERRGDRGDRGRERPRGEGRLRPSGEGRPEREPRPAGVGGGGAGDLVPLPETPRRPSERYPLASGPQAEAARRSMDLLLRISGLELEARILQGEERIEVDLTGTDADWCFTEEGELLAAFEHLLPRMIRSLSGETPLVRVDCDNFHEIREERLRSMAQRIADDVRRLGRPRTLEPMNPADRRIVHLTLSDDPGVVTESEGEGYFKRITVRPA